MHPQELPNGITPEIRGDKTCYRYGDRLFDAPPVFTPRFRLTDRAKGVEEIRGIKGSKTPPVKTEIVMWTRKEPYEPDDVSEVYTQSVEGYITSPPPTDPIASLADELRKAQASYIQLSKEGQHNIEKAYYEDPLGFRSHQFKQFEIIFSQNVLRQEFNHFKAGTPTPFLR